MLGVPQEGNARAPQGGNKNKNDVGKKGGEVKKKERRVHLERDPMSDKCSQPDARQDLPMLLLSHTPPATTTNGSTTTTTTRSIQAGEGQTWNAQVRTESIAVGRV